MEIADAISEIQSSELDRADQRKLRRLLFNNQHLLLACVPGDVVPFLHDELMLLLLRRYIHMLSSLLAAYAAAFFMPLKLPVARTQAQLLILTFS